MSQLNPYIRFNDGKCREAMEFYKACIGGELEFSTIGDSPMAAEMPEEKRGNIMHSTLTKDGWVLMGSDMMMDKAAIGDNVGISLNVESEEEIRSAFEKLSEGGQVFMPIEEAYWGALFGVLTDKYGVEWMINFQKTK